MRQGLKTYSNWPTYPQLYGDGALIGGLDIVKEMKEDGELKAALPAAAHPAPHHARRHAQTAAERRPWAHQAVRELRDPPARVKHERMHA